jgi:hypothetical protein
MDTRRMTYALHLAQVRRQLAASPEALRQSQHQRDYALLACRMPSPAGGITRRRLGRLSQWIRHILWLTAPRRLCRATTPGVAGQRQPIRAAASRSHGPSARMD